MVFKLTLLLKVPFLQIGLLAHCLKCKHGGRRLYKCISNGVWSDAKYGVCMEISWSCCHILQIYTDWVQTGKCKCHYVTCKQHNMQKKSKNNSAEAEHEPTNAFLTYWTERRNHDLIYERPKPYTVTSCLRERQTTVAYSFSRNKTFDPANHTSTGQTGFLGSYPKQVHSLHKVGLLTVVVHAPDCEIPNSGNAGKSGCMWNLSLRYYFMKIVFVFHTLSSV